ncbi:hypothetical protein [Methylotuvimicrobium alcaliphilum]|uniref:Transposase n=1 Tax=Methylotuvimicrobium alcaliphilum (strain DSM 19304 / NCIMB 14124 / VKM B-2133 / 20Z) TaxID=1091494 RepID=G4SYZ7_META2|nr:protein of unknown function [Methylotuvimicrobium alcaliphilum 20Z]
MTRYVVLNPVRAGMVATPGDWLWSSYRAMIGEAPTPIRLATGGLLAQFSTRPLGAKKWGIDSAQGSGKI